MFMKKNILLLSLILMVMGAYSQSVTIDSRLYAKYAEEDLLRIQSNNPADIEYMNWFVENAFVVKEIRNPETSAFPKLRYMDKETKMAGSEVAAYNPETFNVMEYDFEIDPKSSSAYLIGNTGKLLVFYSGETLTKLFNEYRRTQHENE